jgi:hypothetical protein
MCWLDAPWISSLLSGLIGALVGGFIAGYFSLRAVKLAHKHTVELEEKKRAKLIEGYLQGIHDEVDTLYKGFQRTVGANLNDLPNGQPLLGHYPVPRGISIIYEGNASLLGQVDDPDLRRMIVHVYVTAHGLVSALEVHNERLAKYELARTEANQQQKQAFELTAAEISQRLIEYAPLLKTYYNGFERMTIQLLEKLNQKGYGGPPKNNA